ncbi:MAG TPA: universal stress protein [Steroidobacteraceae bacterium]|nr:universal stress protein [Steroidobacteraceae bacterium]
MDLKIERIMVGVSGASRKVIAAATELCRKSHTKLDLVSIVPPTASHLGMTDAERLKHTHLLAAGQRLGLERLAKPLRAQGLTVHCHVEINRSVTEGLLDCIRRFKPSLVAIEAHKHTILSRVFLTQTDYNLVRYCRVPLWIVKNSPRVHRTAVLAALDPGRTNDKPSSLDDEIITCARGLVRILGGAVHSAHIYAPLVGYVGDAMFAPAAIPVSLPVQQKYIARIRKQFKTLSSRYRIAPRRVHLKMGDPAFELPSLARSIRARMVVMGAVARGAVKRALIGNTAERVLDAMPCDVLVVKPKDFRAAG